MLRSCGSACGPTATIRPPWWARGRAGRDRPHSDATFAAVRRLIEASTLSYAQIRARTGVSHASICRWARDAGWRRPPFAPRATDTVPTARASAKLKRRTLAARLDALAERHIRELEESACVDPGKLGEALELLKMAKLAARRRPRRRPGDIAPEEAARPIMQLAVGGVDLSRAPRAAVEDFLAHREPPPEPVGPRGRGSRRQREHAWMMERERRQHPARSLRLILRRREAPSRRMGAAPCLDTLPSAVLELGSLRVMRFWTIPNSHSFLCVMMRKSTHTREYAIFLELLIEARRRTGRTQAQMGEKLPFEQPGISKIERGERRLDVIELRMLCEGLGIKLGDFIAELERRLTKKNG